MNKAVCKFCYRVQGREWNHNQETYWQLGRIECPAEHPEFKNVYRMYLQKPDEQRILETTHPPDWCAYPIEHLLMEADGSSLSF